MMVSPKIGVSAVAITRFEEIPEEIKLMIFSFLKLRDVRPLFFLNKNLNCILKDNLFWKGMFKYYYPEVYKELLQQKDMDWLQKLCEVKVLKNKNLLNYLDLYLEFLDKKPIQYGHAPVKLKQFSTIQTYLIDVNFDPSKWFDLIFILRDNAKQLREIKHRTLTHVLLSDILHALAALIITHLRLTRHWKKRIDALIGNIDQLESKRKASIPIDATEAEQIQVEINQTILKLAMCGDEKYFSIAKERNLIDPRYEITFTYLPEDTIAEQFKPDYHEQFYTRNFKTITGLTYEQFQNKSLNLESEEITPTHKI